MGYEKGTVFVHNNKLYLFLNYAGTKDFKQQYWLRGTEGDIVVLAEECEFLTSPSEIAMIDLKKNRK